jgi:hypothetical protein
MKYQLNPECLNCEPLVLNIAVEFAQSNDVLQEARNVIKKVSFSDKDYVVKSFKKPNFLNQLLYTYFRPSKALRSYEYSLKIAQFVPKGIAYVECYDKGLLSESFFISECFDYDFTIREVLTDPEFADRDVIYTQFAKFAYELHDQGVLHRDFSPGNILIKRSAEGYIFNIIDINRMDFKALTLKERMKNFSMLWASDADLAFIAEQYAGFSGLNSVECQRLAQSFNHSNKRFKNFKKRLKGRPVTD